MNKDINAIGIVRQMVADGQISQEVAEKYFPELAESEDEGVCKKLIAFLKQCKAVYGDGFKQFGLDIDDAIAWLEQQGEQKCQYISRPKYIGEEELLGEQKPTEEYNITSLGSKNAQGKLGEMIKKLKPVNKVLEQKPTEWSEKDVKCIEYAIYACLKAFGTHSDTAEWLEQLKNRVQSQPNQERKDAFIEKAKKWFEKRNEWIDIDGTLQCDMEGFEDFRKYMEGE